MGKFDGILITSDWDGTIFDGRCVPEKSIKAIKYFQDNGGKFTLCSGRPSEYMKRFTEIVKPNTYALALNGTVICNLETDEILREKFIDRDAYRIALELIDRGIEVGRVAAAVKGRDDFIWMTPEEFRARIDELVEYRVYKLAMGVAHAPDGDILIKEAGKLDTGHYYVTRSYREYLEIMRSDCSKGRASLYLKNLLGAKLLVCMGDYENDTTMFECADVSYAPENALDTIKAMATHITSHVSDGAVASVIEHIEKNYA